MTDFKQLVETAINLKNEYKARHQNVFTGFYCEKCDQCSDDYGDKENCVDCKLPLIECVCDDPREKCKACGKISYEIHDIESAIEHFAERLEDEDEVNAETAEAGLQEIIKFYRAERDKEKLMNKEILFTGNNALEVMLFVGEQLRYRKPPNQAEFDSDLTDKDYSIDIPTTDGIKTAYRGDSALRINGEYKIKAKEEQK
jgi:hypothetical protein